MWIVSVKCHTCVLRMDTGFLCSLFCEDVSTCNPVFKKNFRVIQ